MLPFPLTTFNVLTLLLLGLTIWLGYSRFSTKLESNWPLFYYLALYAHFRAFEGGLNAYWVYVGVVAGMLLRFEFMGGWVLKLVRTVELVVLGYVAWRCVGLVMMW